jgi:hypothetical protein
MAYLKPPTTAELKGMEALKRAELAASWRTISQHLKQHREHVNLTGWERYALHRADEIGGQTIHDELEDLLRDFFTIAGSNFGLEQEDYKRKRQKDK